MNTTLRVSEETLKRLNEIKDKFGFSSLDAVIKALINNVKRIEMNLEGTNGERHI